MRLFQEDILNVLGMLGWNPTLIHSTHWSSLDKTGLSRTNKSQRLLRLYESAHLVDLVARKYRDDVVPFGYRFPGRPPDV